MHIVDGDQGHVHGSNGEYTHDHTHQHTYEHSHEHTHAEGEEHTHEHTHEHHEHSHDHAHEHHHEHCGACAQGGKPANEQEALLAYMLDHNKHHAAELIDVAGKFRADGRENVAVQIEKAVENFDKGNMYLSLALSLVNEPS